MTEPVTVLWIANGLGPVRRARLAALADAPGDAVLACGFNVPGWDMGAVARCDPADPPRPEASAVCYLPPDLDEGIDRHREVLEAGMAALESVRYDTPLARVKAAWRAMRTAAGD